jgi:hypothetical protein
MQKRENFLNLENIVEYTIIDPNLSKNDSSLVLYTDDHIDNTFYNEIRDFIAVIQATSKIKVINAQGFFSDPTMLQFGYMT